MHRNSKKLPFKGGGTQPASNSQYGFSDWLSFKHDYSCEHSKDMQVYASKNVNSAKNNSHENISEVV